MKQLSTFILCLIASALSAQFSVTQLGLPAQFDMLLTKRSDQVSVRDLTATTITTTTTRNGVTTRRRTVRCELQARKNITSIYVPTMDIRDQIGGDEGVIESISGGFRVTTPTKFIKHGLANDPSVSFIGDLMQETGQRVIEYSPSGMTATVNRTQYEFFMTNPFPLSFTPAQIDSAIEDGMIGSCNWVIKWGSAIIFAVKPERVIRDVRTTLNGIRTAADLARATRSERTFVDQPSDRIQNIFPRIAIENGRLINASIINGKPWNEVPATIKSPSGQNLVWNWAIGIFNDCPVNDGTFSVQMGPAISDNKRCDWEFMPYSDFTSFTLVASTTEQPRIDKVAKVIYYNPTRRCVFSLHFRQFWPDKGFEADGYTDKSGFYEDALPYFLLKSADR